MFSGFVLLALLVGCALAARTDDEIKIVDFNRSLFIANETYQFIMVPQFMVPLQVYRHVIYTATTETVNTNIKRALWQNRKRLVDLAPEDHELLGDYMGDSLPSFVKVNHKKRSIPADENGIRSITLANNVALLVQQDSITSQKRGGVQLGGAFCLHIPFFTTCDNSGDLDNVKKTMEFQIDAFRTELDSYKETNDARASEMAKVLDKQRVLIQSFAAEVDQTATLIDSVASAAASNAAQQAHGDYIAHAQITYLQRTTNSLLRFANAMASSDARSVVAQPSLSKLFTGYLSVLGYLPKIDLPANKTYAYTPIVDNRTFNWVENPLPSSVVSNITTVTQPYISNATLMQQILGFYVATTVACQDTGPYKPRCSTIFVGSNKMVVASEGGDQWIFGPIHLNHTGVYPIAPIAAGSYNTVSYQQVIRPDPVGPPKIDGGLTTVSTLYCADFMGFKSLTTFNSTPNLLNGIPTPSISPFTDCANYLLRNKQTDITYILYGVREGVIIPFYSNCKPRQIINETGTSTTISFIANYPNGGLDDPAATTSTVYHVNAEHWISRNCYINLEPEWLGMDYYFTGTPSVISTIPRGHKLTQFTINPAGELASSLEFVYTRDWAWVYQVHLVSDNVVIVDEAVALDQSLVLFHLNGSSIVDASDSFYGVSNNGRDCIRKATTYDYDLTACFFQNDEQQYSADQYLTGQVKTTGIARYTDKFNFNLQVWGGQSAVTYNFTLTPKSDADFSYTIQYQGSICPKLLVSDSSTSGCSYSFYYSGGSTVTFGSRNTTAVALNFNTPSHIVNQSVSFGGANALSNFLFVDGVSCLLLQCSYSSGNSQSYVEVSPKKIDIVSAADKALNGSVNYAVQTSTSDTIKQLQNISGEVAASHVKVNEIVNKLGQFDFNTSKIVPYEDFSDLRAKVDSLVDSLQPAGSRACASGVFGAAGCWFEDLISALIVIAIVAGIGIGVYCVCFKFGLIGKLCGK